MASLAKESRKTVVAIVGTTGVGKSQLAIELALSLSGKLGSGQREDAAQAVSGRRTSAEIINADSMQVYRGLDIITNKATREERQQVPHHLMDFLDPGEEYRVDRFRKDAMQKVDEISERGALPILVGGTMYFVQHLLFPGKLVSAETDPTSSSGKANPKSIAELPQQLQDRVKQLPDSLIHLSFQLQDLPAISSPDEFPADFPIQQIPYEFRPPGELSAALHRILQSIDPAIAQRWHWRDVRKVRRSLEVALQTGMPHSEIMAQQKQVEPVAEYRTLILWLYSDPKILEPRLDGRVEKMLERGLLNELKEMREIAQKNQHVDMSKGIYQAIGYKEFSQYFDADNDKDTLFRAALEEMKLGTRQYSRKQVKWLRNQTVPAVKRVNDALSVPDMHIYVLDATDLGRWQVDVQDTAVRILRDFLEEREMPDPLETTEIASSLFVPPKAEGPRRKIACEVCSDQSGRPMMLEEGGQMEAHLRSWSHRKRLQKSGRVV